MHNSHIGQIEATDLPIMTAEPEQGWRLKTACLFLTGNNEIGLLTIDALKYGGFEAEAEQLGVYSMDGAGIK